MSWTKDREYVPKAGGNDKAPEEDRVVITFKPFAVGEHGPFVGDVLRRSRELREGAQGAQAKLDVMEETGKIDEHALAKILDDQAEGGTEILRHVFEQRVTGGRRGEDKAADWQEVWDNVRGDDALVQEIADAILTSAGVGSTVPFVSPSTGAAKG